MEEAKEALGMGMYELDVGARMTVSGSMLDVSLSLIPSHLSCPVIECHQSAKIQLRHLPLVFETRSP